MDIRYITLISGILSFIFLVVILALGDMIHNSGLALAMWLVLTVALIPTTIVTVRYLRTIFPEYFESWENPP